MDEISPRDLLANLIAERGENYGALSRLLGRNAAYIQQFIKRGTPRKLDEDDRRTLARYFGIDEALLGGPQLPGQEMDGAKKSFKSKYLSLVPRLDLQASAGSGSIVRDERSVETIGFDRRWLRRQGLSEANLSIIDVKGESMSPTLNDGDTIMVNRQDGADRLRDGIYVLRLDDALMVKRVALSPSDGGSMTVSSDNPHYPRWEDVDRGLVNIVGRVIWCSRLIA